MSVRAQLSRLFFVALLGWVLGACGACNSVFYQPDPFLHLLPSTFDLEHEPFRLQLFEEESVTGWRVFAPGVQPVGTIVQFHGNAQNMTAHFSFLFWLAQKGFELVVFDYRGYGASEGRPTRDGTVSDGVLVLRLVERDWKRQNIFVVGQSLGGAVAVASLAQASVTNVRGVVLESTFSTYRGLARQKLADIWLTWPFQYPLSFLVSDDEAPVEKVHYLSKTPWLQFHGTEDEVVPFSFGVDLFSAARESAESGIERTFVELPGQRHTPAFLDPDPANRDLTLAFLCRHHTHPDECNNMVSKRQIVFPEPKGRRGSDL